MLFQIQVQIVIQVVVNQVIIQEVLIIQLHLQMVAENMIFRNVILLMGDMNLYLQVVQQEDNLESLNKIQIIIILQFIIVIGDKNVELLLQVL